jgi:DNA-directed RNA polymerase subunit L
MKLTLIEKKKDKIAIEVQGEDHTLPNLLRENAWKSGCKQSSYFIGHPYLSEPKIVIRSDDPEKTIKNAVQMVFDQAKDFEKELKRVLRK